MDLKQADQNRQEAITVKKARTILVKAGITLAFPVLMFVIFYLITRISPDTVKLNTNLIGNIFTNCGTGILIALGMSVNMSTNRIDLSAGAVTSLVAIVIGNMAKAGSWGIIPYLLAVMAFGIILSFINGVIYVSLKIPSVIVSLGYTMILEAGTILYRGGLGLDVMGTDSLIRTYGAAPTIYIILILAVVGYHVVTEYTRFAADLKALAGNKKIAIDSGISEKKNVLVSYALSGLFYGLAAVPYIYHYGKVAPVSNMSSANVMFDAMLPVLIGGFLARFSCQAIAVVVSVIAMKIMCYGLICFGFNSTMQNVVSGVFIIALIIIIDRINTRQHKNLVRVRVKQLLTERMQE